jgi:glycosyltransferase involved in cell wall biosynthesis
LAQGWLAESNDLKTSSSAQKVLFDATLMLRHGFRSAVGITRVEHYVAEYLARDPEVTLGFVTFDGRRGMYRSATEREHELLEQILFRRYTTPTADPSDAPDAAASSAERKAIQASKLELGVVLSHQVSPSLATGHWPRLRTRIHLVASLGQHEFNHALNTFALRRLPIRPDQSKLSRAATRVLRRLLLAFAKTVHRAVRVATATPRTIAGLVRRLAAPDPEALPEPEAIYDYDPFRPGDVLLSMANTWDYMDYGYLAKVCREMELRLICVIYDVVSMELPFVTPSPAHLYHRHWVEIGHLSERLIAISRFTAESYDRFISSPNRIDVPVDHTLLPNFLRERAAEIGEIEVSELIGRSFVVYCSTIEVRKNHILLLHLWEELRQRVPPERLPILVFAGKWGWSAETVRLLAERNWRLRPHLRVMDKISDAELIWLYRHARFTVFPSLTEGFGLAAAESLSFGTPVVVSDCPALLEATERLMPAFHPHDFIGWRQELEHLICDEGYLEALRAKAALFRGPAYDAFAAKIRDAALAPPPTARLPSDLVVMKEGRQ